MTNTQSNEAGAGAAGGRRQERDDRRTEVRPADAPVPSSPPADEDAVRKGVEILGRVKPY